MMTNEEKAKEICHGYNYHGRLTPQGVLGFAVDRCKEMANWKDQQFKEHLEENLSDIIFACIEEYNERKDSLNNNGTLRNDYQLAQDIVIFYKSKIFSKLF